MMNALYVAQSCSERDCATIQYRSMVVRKSAMKHEMGNSTETRAVLKAEEFQAWWQKRGDLEKRLGTEAGRAGWRAVGDGRMVNPEGRGGAPSSTGLRIQTLFFPPDCCKPGAWAPLFGGCTLFRRVSPERVAEHRMQGTLCASVTARLLRESKFLALLCATTVLSTLLLLGYGDDPDAAPLVHWNSMVCCLCAHVPRKPFKSLPPFSPAQTFVQTLVPDGLLPHLPTSVHEHAYGHENDKDKAKAKDKDSDKDMDKDKDQEKDKTPPSRAKCAAKEVVGC